MPSSPTAVAVTVAILIGYNALQHVLLPSPLYVPANLAVAAAVVAIALREGITFEELGLARARLRDGARLGLAAAALIALAVVVAAIIPAARDAFMDRRAANIGIAGLIYQVLLLIPFGTVVLEEVAFRGALLAQVARRAGIRAGVALSSLLFGLWHVLPSRALVTGNEAVAEVADGAGGRVLTVAGAVVVTGVAGALLSWLRLYSGSLGAPMLAHAASNGCAFGAAYVLMS